MSLLQTIITWAWARVGTLLYAGQLISIINFPLAQRLDLQEKADNADPLASQLELMTARWDVAWLWIPPFAGILKLLDHPLWPAACLIAGGQDTGPTHARRADRICRRTRHDLRRLRLSHSHRSGGNCRGPR